MPPGGARDVPQCGFQIQLLCPQTIQCQLSRMYSHFTEQDSGVEALVKHLSVLYFYIFLFVNSVVRKSSKWSLALKITQLCWLD